MRRREKLCSQSTSIDTHTPKTQIQIGRLVWHSMSMLVLRNDYHTRPSLYGNGVEPPFVFLISKHSFAFCHIRFLVNPKKESKQNIISVVRLNWDENKCSAAIRNEVINSFDENVCWIYHLLNVFNFPHFPFRFNLFFFLFDEIPNSLANSFAKQTKYLCWLWRACVYMSVTVKSLVQNAIKFMSISCPVEWDMRYEWKLWKISSLSSDWFSWTLYSLRCGLYPSLKAKFVNIYREQHSMPPRRRIFR